MTRLDPNRVAFADEQVVQMLVGRDHARVIVRVAEDAQDDDDVDHRREDRAQPLGTVEMLQQPFFRLAHRLGAQRLDRRLLVELEKPVGAEEKLPPARGNQLRRLAEPIGGIGVQVQLGDSLLGSDVALVAKRRDDAQRQDHRPRPRRHVVEVEVKPFGQQHDFRRDARTGGEADLPEAGEEELGEGVALLRAAELMDDPAGRDHVRRVARVSHQLEREIGLDRSRKVRLPARVHVPSAIRLLEPAEIVGDERKLWVTLLSEDELHQEVLGFEDAVALQFPNPITIGVLSAQQRSLRAMNRLLDRLGGDFTEDRADAGQPGLRACDGHPRGRYHARENAATSSAACHADAVMLS